jgi:GH24 family phage-related lysozyme (muramidase)
MPNVELTFLKDSVLKHRPVPSNDLSDAEKDPIKAGTTIQVSAIRPELERGHIFVTLSQDPGSKFKTVDGKNSVYLYADHTNFVAPDLSSPTERSAAAGYKTIGAEGFKCITHYEGCRLTPYYCSAGVLTVGWGSTGKHVQENMQITQKEADDLLKADLVRFEEGVIECITVPITRGMFDAAVSFSFNCGVEALRDSTLLKKLNAGDYDAVGEQFMRWTNQGLAGLVSRRKSEVDLFYTGKFKPHN